MVRRSPEGREWFRQTLIRFEGPLLRYTRKITGDLEVAKEVVQDSMLKLWNQKLAEIRGHVAPWLYTVCRNKAIDLKRREKGMTEIDDNVIGYQSYPEEELLKKEVFREISKLSNKHQEVLLLKFQEGMSYKEIAKITGHSESNVGLLIHEGMSQLRETFKTGSEGGTNE